MVVTFYQRRPLLHGSFSIEKVFDAVRKFLPVDIQSKISVSRFESRGFLPRVYNIIEAFFRQGDINHVTGDVHYVTYLLRKKRTLLSIMDVGTLKRLNGWKKWLFYVLWYWLPAKRSSLITVISQSTKNELLQHIKFDADNVRVVYCPISDNFKPNHKIFNVDRPRILQIGVTENKNINRLIQALLGVNCHLRIVGVLSEGQKMALEEQHVNFTSVFNISEVELLQEYKDCDIVIFASTDEGFGLPIIEAQATGRAVITSNISSMPEVAGDGACFVDPYDVESIRAGIMRVIRDHDFRDNLIKLGFQNVKRFQSQVIAQEYFKLYQEVLSS